jgi:hypothetical protein
MCPAPASSRIGAVDRQTVVIRLELHLADESLTGRASDGTGSAREFVGWLGLVAAIDALVPGNSPAPRAPASIKAVEEGESS